MDVVDPDFPGLWQVNVNRNLQDWEIEEYESLLQTLATNHVSNWEDKLKWLLTKNEIFFCQILIQFPSW